MAKAAEQQELITGAGRCFTGLSSITQECRTKRGKEHPTESYTTGTVLKLQNIKKSQARHTRVNTSTLFLERSSDLIFFSYLVNFCNTKAVMLPPHLPGGSTRCKQHWCLVKLNRGPKLHQRGKKNCSGVAQGAIATQQFLFLKT